MPVPDNYERTEAPSKNMRAKDFNVGARWDLEIADVELEAMKDRKDETKTEEKICLHFQGKEKRYVPNVGATMFLEDSLGKHPNNWIGATITLGVFRVQYGDDFTNGFKVLNATPAPGKESPEQFTAKDEDVPFSVLLPFLVAGLGLLA